MQVLTVADRTKTPGVYGLIDPRDPGRIRYVGASGCIEHRLRGHLYARPSFHVTDPRAHWLAELRRMGVAPQAVVLQRGVFPHGSKERHAAEAWWIGLLALHDEADLNVRLSAKICKRAVSRFSKWQMAALYLRKIAAPKCTFSAPRAKDAMVQSSTCTAPHLTSLEGEVRGAESTGQDAASSLVSANPQILRIRKNCANDLGGAP